MADPIQSAIYKMGLDPGDYQRQAQSVAGSNESLVNSMARVTVSEEKVQQTTARTGDAFSRLEARYDPLIRNEQRRQAAIEQATRVAEEQGVAQDRLAAQIGRINSFYGSQVAPATRAAGASRNYGIAIQQAGFQVGDFAVQVASGQGALRAFIQQGSQLLGVFGAWGAVAGAGLAIIGALATAFIGSGNSALDMARQIDKAAAGGRDLDKAFNDAATAADLLKQANDSANDVLETSIERQKRLNDEKEKGAIADNKAAFALLSHQEAELEAQRTALQNQQLPGRYGAYQPDNSKIISEIDAQIEKITGKAADLNDQLHRLLTEPPGEEEDKRAEAAKKLTDAYVGLTQELSPLTKAYDDYAAKQKTINDAVAAGITTQDAATTQLKLLDAAYKDALDPVGALRRELDKQISLLKLSDDEREIQNQLLAIEGDLRKKGVVLTKSQTEALEAQLKVIQSLKDAGPVKDSVNQQSGRAIKDTLQLKDAAKDLGLTFSSAFEDAVVEGKALQDVLQGIEKDILRILARKFGTEPLINSIFGILDGLGDSGGTSGQKGPKGGSSDFSSLFGLVGSLFSSGTNSQGFRMTGAGPGASANTQTSSGWIGSLIGGLGSLLASFEGGGIMTSRGPVPLRKYDMGGIATSPQLAMFAEGSTPEAFIPVPSGKVPVQIQQPANENRRVTNNVVLNLPPAPNSFGYSPDQIAARTMEKIAMSRRNM